MAIHLITLGGLRAHADDDELDWLPNQRLRAALFVYLAIERQVSREVLTTVFWPESDAENARHALRQCLYQLRKAFGEKWLEVRTHDLRISEQVRTDARDFMAALEHGDAESAARLYRGPFLDGVHLVAVHAWESWVDARRGQYARAFRRACREWLDAIQASGDGAGALEAAEWWVARDPSDDEAQHRLIQLLADTGERAEAIRQYEAYTRLLEADELRPLDETVALVDRLRTQPHPIPGLIGRESAASVPAPNPTQVTAPRALRRSRALASALVAVALISAAAWVLGRRLGAPAIPVSANAIAVLPFTVHGDEQAEYLGDGIVNLLATALDGAASLRAVDTRAVHAAVGEAGDVARNRENGRRVAARLGTGMYILGDVVSAGDRLQIQAVVYDRDRSGKPRAEAVVAGSTNDLFGLVDQLAARLLADLGDASASHLLRSAAVTTPSLPAFKAYLEGESLMRAGAFERAADAYLAAIARDSTFGLAYYRLALAREWAPLPGNEDAASTAARYADRLSAHDRSLLDAHRAWRAGDAVVAERRFRAIVARYPHDVEAWLQLGEVMFHHGPLRGRRLEESEGAWRRVLAWEPRNLFVLPHPARIAAAAGRVSGVDSLLAAFTPEELRTDRRLVEIVLLRALAAGDTAAALSVMEQMRRWEDFSAWRVAAFVAAFTPDPALTAHVMAKLLGDDRGPAIRADLFWFTSALRLAAGQPEQALAAVAEGVRAEASVVPRWRRHAFRTITEWYAATLPLPYADSTLMRVRADAARASAPGSDGANVFANELGLGRSIRLEPVRLYTVGTLSLRLHDVAAARSAAHGLRRLAQSGEANALVRDLDSGLRARLALVEGRPEEGLRLLQALELRDIQGDVAVTPFASRANERFLRGELLAALGRDAEALQWFGSLGIGSVSEIPLLAPSQLWQGRIYERLGNRTEATRHYMRFAQLWKNSSAQFRSDVVK